MFSDETPWRFDAAPAADADAGDVQLLVEVPPADDRRRGERRHGRPRHRPAELPTAGPRRPPAACARSVVHRCLRRLGPVRRHAGRRGRLPRPKDRRPGGRCKMPVGRAEIATRDAGPKLALFRETAARVGFVPAAAHGDWASVGAGRGLGSIGGAGPGADPHGLARGRTKGGQFGFARSDRAALAHRSADEAAPARPDRSSRGPCRRRTRGIGFDGDESDARMGRGRGPRWAEAIRGADVPQSAPRGVALGDPFVLRWRGRFYLYGTNDGPPLADGREIPVFRSDDLIHWEPLGGALEPIEPAADHWAPEVLAWNGRFFMVVSFGDVDRRGHALWVAVADRPEGPFRLRHADQRPVGAVLDRRLLAARRRRPALPVPLPRLRRGGRPAARDRDRRPADARPADARPGRRATVLRAHCPLAPLRGRPDDAPLRRPDVRRVDDHRRARRRSGGQGRSYCGYSGGNYAGAYGTGEAVADDPLGPYRDLRGARGRSSARPRAWSRGRGTSRSSGPTWSTTGSSSTAGRPGEPGRRVWLCPADWGADGVDDRRPDRPAPAAPAPADRPLAGSTGRPGPARRAGGSSRATGGSTATGCATSAPTGVAGSGLARRACDLAGRLGRRGLSSGFPEAGTGEAGLAIVVRAAGGALARRSGRRPGSSSTGPTGTTARSALADARRRAVRPVGVPRVEVRAGAGRAEVRVDGVRRRDRAWPSRRARAGSGLRARGRRRLRRRLGRSSTERESRRRVPARVRLRDLIYARIEITPTNPRRRPPRSTAQDGSDARARECSTSSPRQDRAPRPSHSIDEDHDVRRVGTVEADRPPRQGSRVMIRLPTRARRPPTSAGPSGSRTRSSRRPAPGTVGSTSTS